MWRLLKLSQICTYSCIRSSFSNFTASGSYFDYVWLKPICFHSLCYLHYHFATRNIFLGIVRYSQKILKLLKIVFASNGHLNNRNSSPRNSLLHIYMLSQDGYLRSISFDDDYLSGNVIAHLHYSQFQT